MRKNPQADAARRALEKQIKQGYESKVSRTDPRNTGVHTRLSMPEIPQKSTIDLQDSGDALYFVVGWSRIGGDDVVGP